ncbi:putative exported protein of unknown function [Bradyrhizobium sp. BTAi1]|nr:putative exported protein of unknown function [Bradyrhizobium sp. BTAi1]
MPGLALASLNLIVALSLVALSLVLGIVISLAAWADALAVRGTTPASSYAERRKLA